jgi:hypothetical protein
VRYLIGILGVSAGDVQLIAAEHWTKKQPNLLPGQLASKVSVVLINLLVAFAPIALVAKRLRKR